MPAPGKGESTCIHPSPAPLARAPISVGRNAGHEPVHQELLPKLERFPGPSRPSTRPAADGSSWLAHKYQPTSHQFLLCYLASFILQRSRLGQVFPFSSISRS